MGKEQKNKPHKAGRNAGVGRRQKFKESKEMRVSVKASGVSGGRADRQNCGRVARALQRQRVSEARRQESHAAPKVVMVLSMSDNVSASSLLKWMREHGASAGLGGGKEEADTEMVEEPPPLGCSGVPTMRGCPTQKRGGGGTMRASFLTPDRSDLLACLEACKVSDTVILLCSPGSQVDPGLATTLAALRVQGMPPACVVLMGVSSGATLHVKAAAKKHALLQVELFAQDPRVLLVNETQDCAELWRHLTSQRAYQPVWRTTRPYVLTEQLKFQKGASETGTLLLTGYVRGATLSVNQLVHLGGLGDFQISQIDGVDEPCASSARHIGAGQQASVVLARPTEDQDLLVVENTVDPLAGEQTWPTEEEMQEAEAGAEEREKRMKKVPKGTSQYQASWIIDSDSEAEAEGEGNSEGEDMMADVEQTKEAALGVSEDKVDEIEEEEEDGDGDGDGEEDEKEMEVMKAELKEVMERRRQQREQEDMEYPDEMDTPLDVVARIRFQKYRGLKSFRSSPWDPREALPREYSRVFAFASLRRAASRALQRQAERARDPAAIHPGTYIRIHIANVPSAAMLRWMAHTSPSDASTAANSASSSASTSPRVLCGLLAHESKLSVLHFGITKSSTYQAPVKSKDPMTISVGFRQISGRPIFSSDSPNSDKHKYERYLRPSASVASLYAPITYPPAPVLGFTCPSSSLPSSPASPALVFSGGLRGPDPDRVTLKRIILSGVPHKVHKRKSVVQFMFHTPEDVRYFRPLDLW
eukprot:CAMPEP_0196581908 /NCGR_PEP_ID=MMETSP1081-20130531/36382_1 /TAXON_ID=36882 /ORGANISM="Pyramimonas amylifera, Strain CCMP720" /LENGTH=759 /DNA_ID=CAMNT_0041902309 /DNA_START=80 /DNA_END=2356 /DNA_ORIENTATION=-